MRGRRTFAGLGLSTISRRARWLVPVSAVVLVGALLTSVPEPAAAQAPPLPPGASASPPQQQMGSTDPLPPATTEQSQGRRGPGLPADPGHPVPPAGPPSPKDWKPTNDRPAEVLALAAGRATAHDGQAVEDVSARTPYSTEFVNADGTRTRRIYQQVAFVADAGGQLRSLDTSIRTSARDGRLEPAVSLSAVSFAPAAGAAADMARLDPGDGVSLGFGIDGAAAVRASVREDAAVYRGVRPDADVELSGGCSTTSMTGRVICPSSTT